MTTTAAHEGDDDIRPIRAILFGQQFVALDDAELMGFSAVARAVCKRWRCACCNPATHLSKPCAFTEATNISAKPIWQMLPINKEATMSDIDRVIPVPHHDQSALAASAEAPPVNTEIYDGDERDLARAANELTEKREELRGSRGHFTHDFQSTFDLPILKYESADKSPLSVEQAARDLTLSRDDVVIRGIAADGGDVTGLREDALRRSRDNEPAEPPPVTEIKLSDTGKFDELGRSVEAHDGIGHMDAVDGIRAWRQQQAAAQAAELAELTGAKEEAERTLAEEIQEPAPPVETPEQAQARAEYERRVIAERQRIATVQQIQRAEHQAKTELQQIKNATLQHFPDMVRPEDIHALKTQNPQRFAHLMQLEAAARQRFDVLNKVNQAKVQTSAEHQVQARAQAVTQRNAINEQFDRTAEDLIAKSIPTMPMEEIRKSARAMLDATGLGQAELSRYWHGEKTLSMRAPQTQLIIAKAAAYDAMKAKAREIRAKPVPPVMAPGTVRTAAFHQDGSIADLKRQLAGAKGIRALQLGTELQKAQRMAKGNR